MWDRLQPGSYRKCFEVPEERGAHRQFPRDQRERWVGQAVSPAAGCQPARRWRRHCRFTVICARRFR